MTCTLPRCDTPTADGIHVCDMHEGDLFTLLGQIPDTLTDAQDTIARLDTRRDTGRSTSTPGTPINLEASERVTELNGLLVSWSQMLHEATGEPGDAGAHYLRANLREIVRHDWAGEMLAELDRAHRRVVACVDVPPDSVVIGKCEGMDDDGELCAGTIVADMILVDPDEPEGKKEPANARCKKCRGRFDADAIMSANVERAEGHWTSLNEAIKLARLVPGMPSRATLYRMAERDEFETRGAEANQLYSAADIVKRLTKMRGTQTAA